MVRAILKLVPFFTEHFVTKLSTSNKQKDSGASYFEIIIVKKLSLLELLE